MSAIMWMRDNGQAREQALQPQQADLVRERIEDIGANPITIGLNDVGILTGFFWIFHSEYH